MITLVLFLPTLGIFKKILFMRIDKCLCCLWMPPSLVVQNVPKDPARNSELGGAAH